MQMRRFLGGALLSAVAATIALGIAELGLALTDFPPGDNDDLHQFVEYDSLRGWRNQAGSSHRLVTTEFTVSLTYNERGYRGPLHEYPKPPGIRRVLVLGDSYLEGYTVPLEQRVAEVAQARLDSLAPGSFEIIALGTSGYSTDQELIWLETEGVRYAPDMVVLLFFENDYWYNLRDRYPLGAKPRFQLDDDSLRLTNSPVSRIPVESARWRDSLERAMPLPRRLIVRHSRLYRLARRAYHRSPVLQGLAARLGASTPWTEASRSADGITLPAEYSIFLPTRPAAADSAVELTTRLLARMRAVSRASGATFLAQYIPSTAAVYPADAPSAALFHRQAPGDPDRFSGVFAEVCRAAQIDCLDPTPRFRALADSLSTRRELLLFPEDGHWNAHGHRLAGLILSEAVQAARSRAKP